MADEDEGRQGRGWAAGRRGRPGGRDGAEPALRGLLGSSPSKIDPVAAMRARDVARPTPDDLRAAEAALVIRRRPPSEGPVSDGAPTPAPAPRPGRPRRSGTRRRGR